MPLANTQRIAFIGFGEVGQTFARGLMANSHVRVAAYDLAFGKGSAPDARAAELGIAAAASGADAARGAAIVISAVTASAAEEVAREAANYLQPGQIFLDVNSAAPSTKQRAAAHVEAAGAHYIEGAVMAAVLQPGLKVQILAGGPKAGEASERLNALGMNLTPVSEVFGRASAMKLCRSIMIKGLEALMVDCADASRKAGVEEEVYASLAATFPSIDWPALAENMRERISRHGIRRAAEMREAAEMLENLGLKPDLARAVADAHQRGAGMPL